MFGSPRRRLFFAGAVLTALLIGSQAVAAAPPSKVPVGTAYTKANGNSTTNSVYTTIVTMTLPAGKYHVSGRGTVQNQTGSDDTISCNLYGGATIFIDANTTYAPVASGTLDAYEALAWEGVIDLAAGGPVWVECISSLPTGAFTSARLVADTIAGIVNVP